MSKPDKWTDITIGIEGVMSVDVNIMGHGTITADGGDTEPYIFLHIEERHQDPPRTKTEEWRCFYLRDPGTERMELAWSAEGLPAD